jgi:hypothetical protein
LAHKPDFSSAIPRIKKKEKFAPKIGQREWCIVQQLVSKNNLCEPNTRKGRRFIQENYQKIINKQRLKFFHYDVNDVSAKRHQTRLDDLMLRSVFNLTN